MKAKRKKQTAVAAPRVRRAKPTLEAELASGARVLLLRTCAEGGVSTNEHADGFRWPLEVGAVVKPTRWDPSATCGNGLHGLLWGQGNAALLADNAPVWIVFSALTADVVEIDASKAKVPEARVEFVGTKADAPNWLAARAPRGKSVVFATLSAGDGGQASAGYGGQASAGAGGQASAGYGGQASAGARGQASAGYGGQASAGARGQASAGDGGQASAGDRGQASAGYGGQASAGDGGQASAGARGQASAGANGALVIRWWDDASKRYRVAVAYVGEDGIEADVVYRLDGAHRFVRVEPQPIAEKLPNGATRWKSP